MATLTISEQSEQEHVKIQIAAFFISICICVSLSVCLIFVHKYPSDDNRLLVLDTKINPNFDSAASMARLPSLGMAKAEAIIEFRSGGIKFKNAQDLDKVKGIGPKTVENMKQYLEFGTE